MRNFGKLFNHVLEQQYNIASKGKTLARISHRNYVDS